MQKFILIGIGGVLGAISRYLIKEINFSIYGWDMPLNTLIVNVTGSFMLALILTTAFEVWKFDLGLRLGIVTGFLGAYTTFSTLCREAAVLMKDGHYFSSLSYITVSTILGLAAVYLGIILAREIVSKLVSNRKEGLEEGSEERVEGGVE